MAKFFAPDSGFNRVITGLADIVVLNLLFLLCCIPVITIGASMSAMYSVALKIAKDKNIGVVKPFFRAFKESFLKSTAMWFIYLVIGVVIYFGLNIVNAQGMSWFFKLVYGIVTLLWAFSITWVWALEAQFSNTVGGTLKNSVLIAITHPFRSIIAVLLNLIPVFVLAIFGGQVFAGIGFVWFLFGFSGVAVVNALLFGKVFDKYIRKIEEAEAKTSVTASEAEAADTEKKA